MLEDIATGSWGNLSNCMDIVDWTLRSDLYDNFQPVEIWRKIQMEPKQWPNWKGKSYEPNLHDYRFKMSIFQGVLPAGWIDPFKKKSGLFQTQNIRVSRSTLTSRFCGCMQTNQRCMPQNQEQCLWSFTIVQRLPKSFTVAMLCSWRVDCIE